MVGFCLGCNEQGTMGYCTKDNDITKLTCSSFTIFTISKAHGNVSVESLR